jgi:hypothetical protein
MRQLPQSRTQTANSSPVLSLPKRLPSPPKKLRELFENKTPSCNSRSNSTAKIKNGRKPHPHNPAEHDINILQPVAAVQHHFLPSTPASTNSSSTNPNQQNQLDHHNPSTHPASPPSHLPSPSRLHASTSHQAIPSESTTSPLPRPNKSVPYPSL